MARSAHGLHKLLGGVVSEDRRFFRVRLLTHTRRILRIGADTKTEIEVLRDRIERLERWTDSPDV